MHQIRELITIPKLSNCNYGSVANMVKKCGGNVKLTDKPEDLIKADKIILAGVGSFDMGIKILKDGGWFDAIKEAVIKNKIPILGICLGMQLFCKSSEEGLEKGFCFFDAHVIKIKKTNENLKIPHMGWNKLIVKKNDSIIASVQYGTEITAAINKENIYGVQFHPEKSHKFGMELITNFLNLKIL